MLIWLVIFTMYLQSKQIRKLELLDYAFVNPSHGARVWLPAAEESSSLVAKKRSQWGCELCLKHHSQKPCP